MHRKRKPLIARGRPRPAKDAMALALEAIHRARTWGEIRAVEKTLIGPAIRRAEAVLDLRLNTKGRVSPSMRQDHARLIHAQLKMLVLFHRHCVKTMGGRAEVRRRLPRLEEAFWKTWELWKRACLP